MSDVFEPGDGVPPGGNPWEASLAELAERWRRERVGHALAEHAGPGGVEIVRIRGADRQPVLRLTEPWQVELWDALREGKTDNGVAKALGAVPPRRQTAARELLTECDRAGLVYRDSGGLVALPVRYEDHQPHRIDG